MEQVYLQMASFRMSGSRLSFLEALEAAAQLGYTGVELAGNDHRQVPNLRKIVDGLGIRVLSAHVQLEEAEESVPELLALGASYLIVPTVNPLDTKDDVLRHAEALNRIGARVRAEGLAFGYHNHNMEFFAPEDVPLLQLLIDHTDPALVGFEYDVGWAAASGIDLMAFLRCNADRIFLIHANEADTVIGPRMLGRSPLIIPRDENGQPQYTQEEAEFHHRRKICDCPMGKGIPVWPEVVTAATKAEAYIVERRYSYLPEPCDSFDEDLQFMKAL